MTERLYTYSEQWAGHGDLIRTQLQETGRVRIAFLTLADLFAACNDLGIDPTTVVFRDGYAEVGGGHGFIELLNRRVSGDGG